VGAWAEWRGGGRLAGCLIQRAAEAAAGSVNQPTKSTNSQPPRAGFLDRLAFHKAMDLISIAQQVGTSRRREVHAEPASFHASPTPSAPHPRPAPLSPPPFLPLTPPHPPSPPKKGREVTKETYFGALDDGIPLPRMAGLEPAAPPAGAAANGAGSGAGAQNRSAPASPRPVGVGWSGWRLGVLATSLWCGVVPRCCTHVLNRTSNRTT
jgi:hypothetical protein